MKEKKLHLNSAANLSNKTDPLLSKTIGEVFSIPFLR